jgi:hypothetical protein
VFVWPGTGTRALLALPASALEVIASLASSTIAAGTSIFFNSDNAKVQRFIALASQLEAGTLSKAGRALFSQLSVAVRSSSVLVGMVVVSDRYVPRPWRVASRTSCYSC